MALISALVLYFTTFIFFLGQLARINILNTSIPIFDICIITLTGSQILTQSKKPLSVKPKNKFVYFLYILWFTYIVNIIIHRFQIVPSIFYLVRLSCLITLIIYPPQISPRYSKFLYLVLLSNIIFGLIQYLFWPDFTSFGALNWDPHLYRLVSTFFDPTFTGLIYLFFLIKIFFSKNTPSFSRYILLFTTYLALALTYSRSTYLSMFIAFSYYSIKSKKIKPALITLLIIITTIIILPRQPGEGTKLERTSSISAKIENYKEGLSLFTKSPIIGFGYNNLSQIRHITNPESHSNHGFDGSLLTILVATGVIGLIIFISASTQYISTSSLALQTMIIGLVVHSFFANSLLYPWVVFLLLVI